MGYRVYKETCVYHEYLRHHPKIKVMITCKHYGCKAKEMPKKGEHPSTLAFRARQKGYKTDIEGNFYCKNCARKYLI